MMSLPIAEALCESLSHGHERVQIVQDRNSGLQAVIAIHSTVLGPALGGLRIRRYAHGLPEALDDALRLSSAMTLKAAAAGLDLGGGKAVIVDDGNAGARQDRLIALAREVERLGGSYITAEDIGTTTADMDLIAEHTQHVVGRSASGAGGVVGGDPSPWTARTVFSGIRAAVWARYGRRSLDGVVVGVIGLGKVGMRLAELLTRSGAQVVAHDPFAPPPPAECGVELEANLDRLLERNLDVLAPCAVGGMIDEMAAVQIRARVICGAANNPLADDSLATTLAQRGILYVPDFLANSGGLIEVDAERKRLTEAELEEHLDGSERRLAQLLTESLETATPALTLAKDRALARIQAAEAHGAALAST